MEIGKETAGASFSPIYINKTPELGVSAVLMEESHTEKFQSASESYRLLICFGESALGIPPKNAR